MWTRDIENRKTHLKNHLGSSQQSIQVAWKSESKMKYSFPLLRKIKENLNELKGRNLSGALFDRILVSSFIASSFPCFSFIKLHIALCHLCKLHTVGSLVLQAGNQ